MNIEIAGLVVFQAILYTWGAGYRLESRDIDSSTWTIVKAQLVEISDQMILSLPAPEAPQFFRLAQ